MAIGTKKREIVFIDEEKCNGCGLCTPNCAEGAIQIIDGKARLVADNLCDGLGACLGHCPEGAITIITREANDFDEQAVEKHLGHKPTGSHEHLKINSMEEHMKEHLSGGCPSARVLNLDEHRSHSKKNALEELEKRPSQLSHWPVKLALIPPTAPFLRGRELLIAADCVGVAYPEVHDGLLEGKSIAIGCPKFDDVEFYTNKLVEMIKHGGITGITVVHMEVPCCGGLNYIAQQAVEKAGSDIPLKAVVIGIRGEKLL